MLIRTDTPDSVQNRFTAFSMQFPSFPHLAEGRGHEPAADVRGGGEMPLPGLAPVGRDVLVQLHPRAGTSLK